jgi:flagellar biosynthesis/type III secretory pathway chaperone
METPLNTLEDLFHEKIMLYQELVECLKQERALLIKTDMDALWEISAKKQSLVSEIEGVRRKILDTLPPCSIDHTMDVSTFSPATVLSVVSHEQRAQLRKAYLALVNLKAETRQRSLENKTLVEQSLEFLDELIGIIANTDGKPVYGNGGSLARGGHANLFLSREV